MGKIRIVSASAGTGKTHWLAEELFEQIRSGAVRPEGVLATTFTNRAADELASRIRGRLLAEGRAEDTHRLRAARIGTVNSVCSKLVSDNAFELGLSPDLNVLDEVAAGTAIRHAISEVVTADETSKLAEIRERIPDEGWYQVVGKIVAFARTNAISANKLAKSAEMSVQGFMSLLGNPETDGDALDQELQSSLREFIKNVASDSVKKTDTALRDANSMITNRHLSWQQWFKLTSLDPSKQWKTEAEKVKEIARRHHGHPRLRNDCESLIRISFDIAARTLAAYEKHKKQWGTIDFIDQEVLALKLLDNKEVFQRLQEELDLVLVDEFQDTSPVQLALFLKLSEAANQSIWVGDQKQSIYGFRETDPSLMDAAIKAIETSGGKIEVLKTSWRSRAPLVELTSRLFTQPFDTCGIPPERVQIDPAPIKRKEPPGLGPILERWNLNARNKDQDAGAVAAVIKDILSDDTVNVWDKASGDSRPIRANDIAILCYRNSTCAKVATELARLNMPAELVQAGLLATPEARTVIAGLKLWEDPSDSLAAAELARIIDYADRGNEWLDNILENPGMSSFEKLAAITNVHLKREEHFVAGTVAVLNHVIEATGVRELCLQWGGTSARLANLDALHSHAVKYEKTCNAKGSGCTSAGLITYLHNLADEEKDHRGQGSDQEAVVISTWHGSKGKEWPVTVLFELDGIRSASALGVQVVSRGDDFDIDNPLAKRWIRYWPNPYNSRTKKTDFHAMLNSHEVTNQTINKEVVQNLRLLYVLWTRARDRLVIAARPGKINHGLTELLQDQAGKPLINEPDEEMVDWCESQISVKVRDSSPLEPAQKPPSAGAWYEYPDEIPDFAPQYINASEIPWTGQVGSPVEIGERMEIKGSVDMEQLGNAIHAFLASDADSLTHEQRTEIVSGLLNKWNVVDVLSVKSVLACSDNLKKWVDSNWPNAIWHREDHLSMRLENGSILSGISDLILEVPDSFIVIDHKSFPGNQQQAIEKASSFGGQLSAYSQMITKATNKPVIGSFIHLPVAGFVLPIILEEHQLTDHTRKHNREKCK